MSSSPQAGEPAAEPAAIPATTGGVGAAGRRDSIAVHKRHIKKRHTNNDPKSAAPAATTVERYDGVTPDLAPEPPSTPPPIQTQGYYNDDGGDENNASDDIEENGYDDDLAEAEYQRDLAAMRAITDNGSTKEGMGLPTFSTPEQRLKELLSRLDSFTLFAWSRFDIDKDGNLNAAEFEAFLRHIAQRDDVATEDCQRFLRQMDQSGDGLIQRDELVQFAGACFPVNPHCPDQIAIPLLYSAYLLTLRVPPYTSPVLAFVSVGFRYARGGRRRICLQKLYACLAGCVC